MKTGSPNKKLTCPSALRKVALFSVGLILLAHSIVPHVHENELSWAEKYSAHTKAHDFFDFLTLAFQQDHSNILDTFLLEDFEKNQHLDAPNSFGFLQSREVLYPFFGLTKTPSASKNHALAKQILEGTFSLRAPPAGGFFA